MYKENMFSRRHLYRMSQKPSGHLEVKRLSMREGGEGNSLGTTFQELAKLQGSPVKIVRFVA